MAIQLIINREWGLAKNENPNQGAFIIDELTELVEEAVLKEFEKIAERGGVLGAMETGYQRGQIQEESMHYEMLKHTGEYPIVGVNTFRNPHGDPVPEHVELARSTDDEKQVQLTRLRDFHARHAAESPADAQAPAAGGDRQRERVRGADGCGARVLAGADHQRPVRSRRAVPPQHVRGTGMSRELVREMKRSLRSGKGAHADDGQRQRARDAALALLVRSVRMGHRRLAVQRLHDAVSFGARSVG